MFSDQKQTSIQNSKKKPPPRPPPPNFSKYRSKSTYSLHNKSENTDLIELSLPVSPNPQRHSLYGGSVSSSYNSSTSSLTSSKKSFECETLNLANLNMWPSTPVNNSNGTSMKQQNTQMPSLSGPTIIRALPNKKGVNSLNNNKYARQSELSLPMPKIPPPNPPKDAKDVHISYAIVLHDFPATHPNDLPLQQNDIVILIRRINSDWLYGKVLEKEGMFPENFVSVQVPLPEDDETVIALYEFRPQRTGDLGLIPGQSIRILNKVSSEWFYGESNGETGLFPSNFVDCIPKSK